MAHYIPKIVTPNFLWHRERLRNAKASEGKRVEEKERKGARKTFETGNLKSKFGLIYALTQTKIMIVHCCNLSSENLSFWQKIAFSTKPRLI